MFLMVAQASSIDALLQTCPRCVCVAMYLLMCRDPVTGVFLVFVALRSLSALLC